MNVKDLLGVPPLSDCEVQTCTERGLLNEVVWVCPSSELNLDRWVVPGVFIICVHRTFDQQREVIEAVGPDKVAAIVHFGCVTEDTEPDRLEEIYRYYDGLDIPLIRCTRRMSLVNFSRHFMALLDDGIDREQEQTRWLEKLCTQPWSNAFIDSRDRELDDAYSYACITIGFTGSRYQRDPVGEELAFSRIKDCLTGRLSLKNPRLMWFSSHDRLVVFVPSLREESAKSFRVRIEAGIEAAKREVRHVKWIVCAGERVRGLRNFRESFENAKRTESIVTRLGIGEGIHFYDDWYTHIQLLDQPREDLERLMRHTLGPILDKPELVESLTNYLYLGENVKEAAEITYVHANTLKYRLGRISELLDVDLRDPTTRFRLRVAVTIYRYLQ